MKLGNPIAPQSAGRILVLSALAFAWPARRNKMRTTIIIPLILAATGWAAAQVPCSVPAGEEGRWAFEGDAMDSAGTHHGTLIGTPTFTSAVAGQGIRFDSNNDGVDIPHDAELGTANSGTGLSISFFMRGNHSNPHSYFLVVDKSHGWIDSTGWLFQGTSSAGRLSFGLGNGGACGNCFTEVFTTDDVLDDSFHHVVGTWDASSGQMALYLDGVLQGTDTVLSPLTNTRPVRIGYSWGAGTPRRFFRGTVDDLRIFTRLLTPVEILGLCSLNDTDNDGLPDDVETNTGVFVDANDTGTDPNVADTDNDGLDDGTEVDLQLSSGVPGCPNPLIADSDGDTILDGVEVDPPMGAPQTDPCKADTDDDGFPDNLDPFPISPDGNQGFIEAEIRVLCVIVQGFDLSLIDAKNNNARKGRRNAMCNKLNAAANATAAGNHQDAIDQLVSLGQKLDGNPQPKDWMILASTERTDLATSIGVTIVLLQFLLP